MTTVPADNGAEWREEDLPTEELARTQGIKPIASIAELESLAHPDLWDSDEQHAEFLADL